VELLGAGGESDTIEFTTTELLAGAAGTPGWGCAGPEDGGGPGSATPPVAVGEGGPDPEAAAGGAGGEALPLTAGVPASDPAAAPGGGQLEAAVPPPSPEPSGAAHESSELSPGELIVEPPPEGASLPPEGASLLGDEVVAEADEVGEVGAGEVEVGAGEVPASEPVPAEQSLDPGTAPPAAESLAAA
jgi:hypothetical protein